MNFSKLINYIVAAFYNQSQPSKNVKSIAREIDIYIVVSEIIDDVACMFRCCTHALKKIKHACSYICIN